MIYQYLLSVIFLKNRNAILERGDYIIYKSKCAFLIQRYWKKYILIKRIKDAANIYKLTRNFSQFISRPMTGKPMKIETSPPYKYNPDANSEHIQVRSDSNEYEDERKRLKKLNDLQMRREKVASIERANQIVRDWNN